MSDPALSDTTVIMATMHRKEQVIAPILAEVGLVVQVPSTFNSDAFGTFTRDVARAGSQIEAARAKIARALEITGNAVGMASEGAFGPHPAMPWVASNREVVVLCDRTTGLEIIGEALSAETNYRQQQITSVTAAVEFANQVGFPQHGLVVMPASNPDPKDTLYKGITQPHQLEQAVEAVLAQQATAWIETDMRALYNPTRMGVIEQATRDLVTKLQQHCPQCRWPGFTVQQRLPGLPCGLCGLPTLLTHSLVYGCQHCGHRVTTPFPDGQTQADPGQCAYCNP